MLANRRPSFAARLSTLALAAALPVSACDSGTEDAIRTVTYSGKLVNGVDNTAVVGAHICFVSESTIPCVDTDANGGYTVHNLQAGSKVEVEVTKTDFISIASNFIVRDNDFTINAQMFPSAAVALAFQALGESFDAGKGGLLVRVYDPAVGATVGLAGVTVTIEPKDGIGPFYAEGLTFTRGEATGTVGNALFANLEAKDYKVTFASADHTCQGTYLWKTSDGRVDAKAKLGFATYLYVDCAAN